MNNRLDFGCATLMKTKLQSGLCPADEIGNYRTTYTDYPKVRVSLSLWFDSEEFNLRPVSSGYQSPSQPNPFGPAAWRDDTQDERRNRGSAVPRRGVRFPSR